MNKQLYVLRRTPTTQMQEQGEGWAERHGWTCSAQAWLWGHWWDPGRAHLGAQGTVPAVQAQVGSASRHPALGKAHAPVPGMTVIRLFLHQDPKEALDPGARSPHTWELPSTDSGPNSEWVACPPQLCSLGSPDQTGCQWSPKSPQDQPQSHTSLPPSVGHSPPQLRLTPTWVHSGSLFTEQTCKQHNTHNTGTRVACHEKAASL